MSKQTAEFKKVLIELFLISGSLQLLLVGYVPGLYPTLLKFSFYSERKEFHLVGLTKILMHSFYARRKLPIIKLRINLIKSVGLVSV